MEFFETTYGHILNTALGIANPVKKRIIRTECEVHRIINVQALKILKTMATTRNMYSSAVISRTSVRERYGGPGL